MAKKDPNKYDKRRFLNKDCGIAAIRIVGTKHEGVDVVLSDCNRQITLDFNWYGEDGKKKQLDKLDSLINDLLQVRQFLNGDDI